jgi:aerobic carbon-monoxide dehydrogenase medium subunit
MGGSPIGAAEVIVAASAGEAIEAFGDGAGVTVVAGGTIVMPDITHRRRDAERVALIGNAGMSGIRSEGGRTVIGAGTTLADLSDAVEPLGTCARRVADIEIREQATIGGNLCAPPGVESPRGDLQAALLALDADVHFTGAGGERTEPVEDFLASGREGRLMLDVSFAEPEAAATATVRRPHAHTYTILQVCAARARGEVRVAVSGAGPTAVRSRAVERALADGDDAAAAAERVLDDVTPHDDALASSWYRSKTLPVLVRRALNDLR